MHDLKDTPGYVGRRMAVHDDDAVVAGQEKTRIVPTKGEARHWALNVWDFGFRHAAHRVFVNLKTIL